MVSHSVQHDLETECVRGQFTEFLEAREVCARLTCIELGRVLN